MSTHDTSRLSTPARRVVRAQVSPEPIDEQAHAAAVRDASAGAVVTFAGVVRDHDHGRPVVRLTYVAHPTAQQVIEQVVAEVVAAHPVDAVAVTHRVGDLAIGDGALVVAVSAAHRGEAFRAAEDLVEQVKHRVPIWKEQFFPDGSSEWVSCP